MSLQWSRRCAVPLLLLLLVSLCFYELPGTRPPSAALWSPRATVEAVATAGSYSPSASARFLTEGKPGNSNGGAGAYPGESHRRMSKPTAPQQQPKQFSHGYATLSPLVLGPDSAGDKGTYRPNYMVVVDAGSTGTHTC